MGSDLYGANLLSSRPKLQFRMIGMHSDEKGSVFRPKHLRSVVTVVISYLAIVLTTLEINSGQLQR